MLYISQQSQQKKNPAHFSNPLSINKQVCLSLNPSKGLRMQNKVKSSEQPPSPPPPPYHPSPLPARVELYRVYCTKLIVSHQLDTSIKRKRQFLVCLRQTRVF